MNQQINPQLTLPELKELLVAFDIGQKTNSVAFVHKSGKVLHRYKTIPNNLPGLERVWNKTQTLLAHYGLSTVSFGMEASGPYWLGPYWELEKKCSTFDPELFSVETLNPQIVREFKGKFTYKKQKTNEKDALTVAGRMRFGDYEPSYIPHGKLLTLRLYTRHRLHLILTMTAEKLRFLSILFLKFSEYKKRCKQGKIFSDVFGRCSTAIISKYQTCEEIAAAPLEDLHQIVIENDSTHSVVDVKTKLNFLQQAARESFHLPEETVEPVNFILQQTLENIKFLQQQIKVTDDKIKPIVETIDDPIKSFFGIGPVYAAGIVAETPDLSRYKGHPQLASYLGIIPTMNDTGDFHSGFNKMTKTGNSYGRYYYIEGTNSLRRFNPVFNEYFERKLKEDSRRRFKRALGLTTRKFIRIYFHLKVTNDTFKLPDVSHQLIKIDAAENGKVINYYPR